MKNFLTTILIVGSALTLFSCDNGTYDANPGTNNSLNPLNPSSDVTVPVGNLKIIVNGTEYLYYPAFYVDTVVSDVTSVSAYARLDEDDIFHRQIVFSFGHIEGGYPDLSAKTYGEMRYIFYDTTIKQYISYRGSSLFPPESEIAYPKLRGFENTNLRGMLVAGKLELEKTDKDDNGVFQYPPVSVKTIKINGGEFHMPKRPVTSFPNINALFIKPKK